MKDARLVRPKRREACAGKVKLTEDQARTTAKSASVCNGVRLVAYTCPHCGRWHIGNPGRRHSIDIA